MIPDAYIFPGQGSQNVGMGEALAQRFRSARETFVEADDALQVPLSRLCFSGPAEVLTETQNAQPAILATSIAAWRALREAHPDLLPPCCVAGHSLGEYAALVVAGSLAFVDAMRLTRVRGELMARAGRMHPGSMAAILRLPDDQVADICRQAQQSTRAAVQVANYNSPGQVVISGEAAGVAAAGEMVRAAGGRVMPLAVSVAAHSVLMESAVDDFAAELASVHFSTPNLAVIGNVNATPLLAADEIRTELTKQLTLPVQWTRSIQFMVEQGASRFVEIGTGNVLSGLIRRIAPEVQVANVAMPADVETL